MPVAELLSQVDNEIRILTSVRNTLAELEPEAPRSGRRHKYTMSKEAREKISRAQKARWAKTKKPK